MIDIVKIATYCGIITGAASSLWVAGDYTGVRPVIKLEWAGQNGSTDTKIANLQQQLNEVSKSTLLLRFSQLMEKSKYGGLTFDERQELCRIATILGYVNVPGC